MKFKIIKLGIIVVLFLLFFYTGIEKLLDLNEFEYQMKQVPILSPFSGSIKILLPVTELCVSIMVIFSRCRMAGLYLSISLLSIFSVFLIYLVNLEYYLPCSCGGFLETLPTGLHFALNLIFIGLAVCGIVMERKNQKVGSADIGLYE